jgi:hypothetical protein
MLLCFIQDNLTDNQIFESHWKVDQFEQGWFKINKGHEGITNYIHDLQAGHISDNLFHRRNLFTHSQQGWEALNFAVKRYWFRCTNLGGDHCSGNRLEPLSQWVQHHFVWMMGFEYKQLLEAVKNDIEVDLDNYEGMEHV